MKKKDVMTKRVVYEYNQLDSLADFLEEQAAAGWELTSKVGALLGFRRCAPKKVRIAVELVYSDDNDQYNERFIEYCQAAGWEHIFDDGKVQVFENDDVDAEPIHTDQEIKLATVHRKSRAQQVSNIVAMAIVAWALFIYVRGGLDAMIRDRTIFTAITFVLIDLLCLANLVRYICWYKKAKTAVAEGGQVEYRRTWLTKAQDKLLIVAIFVPALLRMIAVGMDTGTMTPLYVWCGTIAAVLLCVWIFIRYNARTNTDRTNNTPMYVAMCVVLAIVVGFLATMVL